MAVGTGLGMGGVRRLQCSSETLSQFLLSPCSHLLESSILVAGKRRLWIEGELWGLQRGSEV